MSKIERHPHEGTVEIVDRLEHDVKELAIILGNICSWIAVREKETYWLNFVETARRIMGGK